MVSDKSNKRVKKKKHGVQESNTDSFIILLILSFHKEGKFKAVQISTQNNEFTNHFIKSSH